MMEEDMAATSSENGPSNRMCVQVEGEDISPDDCKSSAGWLYIGGHNRKKRQQQDPEEQGAQARAIAGLLPSAGRRDVTCGERIVPRVAQRLAKCIAPASRVPECVSQRGTSQTRHLRGSEQQQQPWEGVSWADAASGNGHKRGNQCCEQLRAANETMARKLEDMEKKLRSMQALIQQQQQQQRYPQGEELQENKADQTSAPQTQHLQQQKKPAQQKQVQPRQQQQQKQHQQEEQPKNDTAMEIAKDEDEYEEAPKKRARPSTKKNYDAQIEKLTTPVGDLTATVGNLTTTVKNLATATEQRFARLEEMLSTLTASHRNLCERFEIVEQTQKIMIRNPIFAAQFANHPYIQEQAQQPTMQ
ncbi:hypothetical protein HPB48_009671 [Haemaphysalis longicornis]|uniref:Uncharacterized protein n=1 Tax=Haemaphysalis longicornis TaxID=44386 RepID=A0A9J6FCV6_HAELO|nr:hypothetical protein HPB48_009671 [Haemaphysalis longicornis]